MRLFWLARCARNYFCPQAVHYAPLFCTFAGHSECQLGLVVDCMGSVGRSTISLRLTTCVSFTSRGAKFTQCRHQHPCTCLRSVLQASLNTHAWTKTDDNYNLTLSVKRIKSSYSLYTTFICSMVLFIRIINCYNEIWCLEVRQLLLLPYNGFFMMVFTVTHK